MDKITQNMHLYIASGNKILLVDDQQAHYAKLKQKQEQQAQKLRDKLVETLISHGMDSAVILWPDNRQRLCFNMIERNGLESNLCGNALRALAHFCLSVEPRQSDSTIKFYSEKPQFPYRSKYAVQRISDKDFLVHLGRVNCQARHMRRFLCDKLAAFKPAYLLDHLQILLEDILPGQILGIADAAGEPHLVLTSFYARLDRYTLKDAIDQHNSQWHEVFPFGININWITAADPDNKTLEVKTFERGINNFTESCSSGIACAAAVYRKSQKWQRHEPIIVHSSGHQLTVHPLRLSRYNIQGGINYLGPLTDRLALHDTPYASTAD